MQTHHLIHLTHMGLLRISGDGAQKLLQGQLTCNLDDLKLGHLQLAAHCNPQGRVISLFHLFHEQNSYYLHLPRTLLPIAANALKKYAVFFKVTVEDASEEFMQLGCFDHPLPENALSFAFQEGAPRFLCLMPADSSVDAVSSNDWQLFEIRSKIPAIYAETSELFLPHELNLPALNAVSFNKGCYTGQEIIARMQYRGKLKKHLIDMTITADEPPKRGSDMAAAGQVVDVCQFDHNQYALLVLASI